MTGIGSSTFWLTLGAWIGWPVVVAAQLEVLTNADPQRVFGGAVREISVVLHNTGGRVIEVEARTRLQQLTSATAVRLDDAPWKHFEVLAGQTVIESALLDLPAVNAETRFLIQWLEGTNRVFGTTELLVYPRNLLKELGTLAGEGSLGAFDPENQLKPLLKNAGVEFVDLQDTGLDRFTGKLAIVGPFASEAPVRDGLTEQIEAAAKRGTAIVWIQPPPKSREKLKPSFYSVPVGRRNVVVVQPSLIADPAENPKSQLNLIQFARMALHPEPLRLPRDEPEP